MKKIHLLFAGMFILATTLVSCSSEEAPVKDTTEAFEFAKTKEMTDFESALKNYMINKQEGKVIAKSNSDGKAMKEKTAQLLNSLGKSELAGQDIETEQLLLVAMREYSKKLTEMYNQRDNQK